jgi:hypothetical protein
MSTDVYAGFWRDNLKKGDHLKDPDTDASAILKQVLKEQNGTVYSGFITFGTASRATVVKK